MKAQLNNIIKLEESTILNEINRSFSFDGNSFSDETIELINANLIINNDNNLAVITHRKIIYSLIYKYISFFHNSYLTELDSIFNFEYTDLINIDIETVIIPELIEEFHVIFLNSEFSISNSKIFRKKSKILLRENGSVYTLKNISKEITENVINIWVRNHNDISNFVALDFACGTGRFYFEAINFLNTNYSISKETIVSNHLYAIDIDIVAIAILRLKVISLFEKLNQNIIRAISENILVKNALLNSDFNTQLFKKSSNLDSYDKIIQNGGFDIVFSNPPYLVLKVNKKTNKEIHDTYYNNLQKKIREEIQYFRNSDKYHYSIEGMLNYYQISIEAILNITKPNGQIGIICPATIFGDLTSSKLRKHILLNHNLQFIRHYSESSKIFENVAQSTVIFYLQKMGVTKNIKIEILNNKFTIDLNTIKKIFPKNLEIPLISKEEWSILLKMSEQPRLKDFKFIRNRRGELDLTLFKDYISKNNTGWRLVRGNMISDEGIKDKNDEFVDIERFLDKKSNDYKNFDFNNVRLICHQISNMDSSKRLKFTFCENTDIISNSCNYITSTRDESDLKKLHFILNSTLLNWRFKITSSNNHINNYELDELPIINLDELNINEFSNDYSSNDEILCKHYGLTENEISLILKRKSNTHTEKNNYA